MLYFHDHIFCLRMSKNPLKHSSLLLLWNAPSVELIRVVIWCKATNLTWIWIPTWVLCRVCKRLHVCLVRFLNYVWQGIWSFKYETHYSTTLLSTPLIFLFDLKWKTSIKLRFYATQLLKFVIWILQSYQSTSIIYLFNDIF